MCKRCETNPVYEFTNQRKLCKNCFIYWFEKKFLYTVRKFKLFLPEEKVSFEYLEDVSSVVLMECLKILENGSRIKMLEPNLKKGFDKFASKSTLDENSFEIISSLVEDNFSLKENQPINGKFVSPLYFFLKKEVKLYADLKKLKYKKEKIQRKDWEKFINELEKEHPEIKHAIINSYLKIS